METKKEIKPLVSEVISMDGCGSETILHIFNRREHNALSIVRRWLGLTYGNAHANKHNDHLKRYKNSGLWQRAKREKIGKNKLVFWVDVGCSCSHDCCGHCCSLCYEVFVNGDFVAVHAHYGYNY